MIFGEEGGKKEKEDGLWFVCFLAQGWVGGLTNYVLSKGLVR
jgi:hypothetical protein